MMLQQNSMRRFPQPGQSVKSWGVMLDAWPSCSPGPSPAAHSDTPMSLVRDFRQQGDGHHLRADQQHAFPVALDARASGPRQVVFPGGVRIVEVVEVGIAQLEELLVDPRQRPQAN